MLELAAFGGLVALDNVRAAFALGMIDLSRARRRQLALSFGAFEALMPVIGFLIGAQLAPLLGPSAEHAGPVVLGVCGFLMLVGSKREARSTALANGPLLLIAVPLSLSLDNLLAGVGLGTLGVSVLMVVPFVGMTSGAIAFVGVYLGGAAAERLPAGMDIAPGLVMVAMAAFLALFG